MDVNGLHGDQLLQRAKMATAQLSLLPLATLAQVLDGSSASWALVVGEENTVLRSLDEW